MKRKIKKMKSKKHFEFSKFMILLEAFLILVITLGFIYLADEAIRFGFEGSLPWLAALPSVAWAAYGVSQAFYYNKSKAENTQKGIVFETAMHAATPEDNETEKNDAGDNNEMPENSILPPINDPNPFGPM